MSAAARFRSDTRARRVRRGLLALMVALSTLPITAVATPPAAAASGPSVLRLFSPIFMGRGWNLTQAQAVTIAQHHDLVIANPYTFRGYVAAMHAANPSVQIVAYVNGMYDMTNGGTTYPASWYAHDASGNRVYSSSFGLYLMDPSNPAWATTVAQECSAMLSLSGYDGCFLDSLGAAVFFPGYDSALPVDPLTGTVWAQTDWLTATNAVAAAVQALNPAMPVVANGIGDGFAYFATPGPTSTVLIPTHVGMAQTFIRPQNGDPQSFRPESKWQQDVDMLVSAESQGESILATTQLFVTATAAETAQWHKFALASFLLGAGGHSYFAFLQANNNSAITQVSKWDHVAIGTPLGHYTQSGSLFERAFSNGLVVVNPGKTAAVLTLSGTYTNLDGQAVTSETMAPHTGDVLLAG